MTLETSVKIAGFREPGAEGSQEISKTLIGGAPHNLDWLFGQVATTPSMEKRR